MRIKRFLTDARGTTFEGIALSVSILAVAFVAGADMLDYVTKPNSKAPVLALRHLAIPASVASNDLDLTPTASTSKPSLPQLVSRSVLDPCTGQAK
jgi:hypothetical protein